MARAWTAIWKRQHKRYTKFLRRQTERKIPVLKRTKQISFKTQVYAHLIPPRKKVTFASQNEQFQPPIETTSFKKPQTKILPLQQAHKRPRKSRKRKPSQQSSRHTETLVQAQFGNITNQKIYNLSQRNLSPLEQTVLSLGLKYIPRPFFPKDIIISELSSSLANLQRRIALNLYFDGTTFISDIPKLDNNTNLWRPPPNKNIDPALHRYTITAKTKALEILKHCKQVYNKKDALIQKTLRTLGTDTSIVIKPADKNLGLVILDRADYVNMCLTHLNNPAVYTLINDYNPKKLYAKLKQVLSKHNKLYALHTKTIRTNYDKSKLAKSLLQLENSSTLRVPPFYCIPKLHKSLHAPIPGRPLCSSPSSLTYHSSLYLDKKLQPLLSHLSTICHSSRQVVHELSTRTFPTNNVILCADVTALYPSIPISEGIYAVQQVCNHFHYLLDELPFLLDLLHWVLTSNYCTFDDKIYLQIQGTAMGTPVAVTFANIFLYYIETPIIQHINARDDSELYYRRYIDDILAITTTHTANFFIEAFQSRIATIKLESITIDKTGVHQDLHLCINPCTDTQTDSQTISFSLFQKPTNCYQYIPFLSAHRPHVFTNFVFQELKRYRLYCSNYRDFENISSQFAQRLIARGYPSYVFSTALANLPSRFSLLNSLRKSLQHTSEHAKTPKLIAILNVPILKPQPCWKNILSPQPHLTSIKKFNKIFNTTKITTSFISSQNASKLLTHSKLPQLTR